MGKIIYDVSMSLDGFIAAAGMTTQDGLGIGGEMLHEWYFTGQDEKDHGILGRYDFGAQIVGRRTYDNSIRWWGAKGPSSAPTVVVSHTVPADIPGDGVYTFVSGLQTAFDTARGLAGDKDIQVMGGNVNGQLLHKGLLDEIAVHLVPVVFGTGLPLFGEGPSQIARHITLEQVDAVATRQATHLRYRVVR